MCSAGRGGHRPGRALDSRAARDFQNGLVLSIGSFSLVTGLSITALRYYDDVGLLTPAYVDPDSGYRRYRPDQVSEARLYATLRRLEVPVDAMRTCGAVVVRGGGRAGRWSCGAVVVRGGGRAGPWSCGAVVVRGRGRAGPWSCGAVVVRGAPAHFHCQAPGSPGGRPRRRLWMTTRAGKDHRTHAALSARADGRLAQVTITTHDLPTSIAFYRDAFDASYHEEIGSFQFGTYPDDDFFLVTVADPDGHPWSGGPAKFGLLVEGVDAAHARALAAGAVEIESPIDRPWKPRSSTVKDPGGNHIDLYQA